MADPRWVLDRLADAIHHVNICLINAYHHIDLGQPARDGLDEIDDALVLAHSGLRHAREALEPPPDPIPAAEVAP